jgi:nucleoside-diphosphate-sugar epimerase
MTTSKETVVVLGASGNVGNLLVDFLASKGYKVRAYGRKQPKFQQERVVNLAVDYDSQDDLDQALESAKYTFVLVGLEYKLKIWQTEWPPLVQKILAATEKSGSKLVFFDNVYPYGLVDGKMTENTPLKPCSKKGQVRKQLDEMILEKLNQTKIKAVIAKSADFYGPGITTSVLGDRFFNLILKSKKLEWFGDPSKVHSYTYVPDIPAALVALAESDFVGNIHLPTASPAITGLQFKELLENLESTKLSISSLNSGMVFWLQLFLPILRELKEMMYQYENDYVFDSTKFERLFPDLKPTTYQDGLKQTLDWYREQK